MDRQLVTSKAYYCRAEVKKTIWEDTAALSDYDTAVSLKPDYIQVYNARGKVKADLGEYTAAMADWTTIIDICHARGGDFRQFNPDMPMWGQVFLPSSLQESRTNKNTFR